MPEKGLTPAERKELEEMLADIFPTVRQPRYRYWTGPRGEMYCYTTEPMSNGKFACWTYRPIGEGSRSGDPQRWTAVDRVDFARRKIAKARAYARYCKACGE